MTALFYSRFQSAFWEAVQKDFGVVPLKIQNILNYLGYTPSLNVENLKPTSIPGIEADMRLVADYLKAQQVNMESFYGVYQSTPDEFKFLQGEKSCIDRLCKLFEDNGANKYLKVHQNSKKQVLTSMETRNLGSNEHVSCEEKIINNKVIYYYESQLRFVRISF